MIRTTTYIHILFLFVFFAISTTVYANTTSWNTISDFSQGTYTSTSPYQTEGDVTLLYTSTSTTHTTVNDFFTNNEPRDEIYSHSFTTNDNGEVALNQGWYYSPNNDLLVGAISTTPS